MLSSDSEKQRVIQRKRVGQHFRTVCRARTDARIARQEGLTNLFTTAPALQEKNPHATLIF